MVAEGIRAEDTTPFPTPVTTSLPTSFPEPFTVAVVVPATSVDDEVGGYALAPLVVLARALAPVLGPADADAVRAVVLRTTCESALEGVCERGR